MARTGAAPMNREPAALQTPVWLVPEVATGELMFTLDQAAELHTVLGSLLAATGRPASESTAGTSAPPKPVQP
ncbi:hypothetical protein LO762_30415 [Actinocorallia sp. API 0066]|uniref:hypothetical protein n=1 Tax=Actinocorallia sp. API 0066 TaxID=2896846 RepID=UPI001E3A7AF2|nr:hypothetical protein [Actinocorallia sp. API 0066]MCD0453465.1 hypothetical protein [Actinocorallia sp. API 0066]